MAIVINGSGTVTGLAVGGLPDGTVDKDTLAVGVQSKVLQVVQGSTATAVSSSTNTFVDTGLTATITPSATTSKILVLIVHNGCNKSSANSNNTIDIRLLRGASTITSAIGALNGTATAVQITTSASIEYLDSPATTAATTYKTQFRSRNNLASVDVQFAGVNTSTITLMEIGV